MHNNEIQNYKSDICVFSHFIINIAFKSYLNKTFLNYFLFNNNFNYNFNQTYILYQLITIKRDFFKSIFFKLQLQYTL
jgi:hypothetical protein